MIKVSDPAATEHVICEQSSLLGQLEDTCGSVLCIQAGGPVPVFA